MVRRLCWVASSALIGVTLVAGCGGSGQTSTLPSTGTATVQTGATATTAAARSDLELEICTSTAARSKLSASGKAAYLALCKRAVIGGDPAVERAAASQCRSIIDSTVPAAAQAAMTADCPRA